LGFVNTFIIIYYYKAPVTLFKQTILPTAFQAKLPEQRHISLVFVFVVQMHVIDCPLLACGIDIGKRRLGWLAGS